MHGIGDFRELFGDERYRTPVRPTYAAPRRVREDAGTEGRRGDPEVVARRIAAAAAAVWNHDGVRLGGADHAHPVDRSWAMEATGPVVADLLAVLARHGCDVDDEQVQDAAGAFAILAARNPAD
ncbi:hypothetical protein GCM10009853_046000 [Glycomyces scopariae]|uniref:Uncharacterized protein n=1 Tax=Glycomyces sambucus TaxID=380244 RepID=A0A1G9DFU4_9ACTN|nr:hypothetical protein [Glycomyces sambucus]SDK62728.1 hypothetical protein SAMN05216298_0867 [Glycomyces sambucus]